MSRANIHDDYRRQIDALLEKNAALRKTIRMVLPLCDSTTKEFQAIHARTHAIACLNGVSCGDCSWCKPPVTVREAPPESGVFRVFQPFRAFTITDNGKGGQKLVGVV